MRETLLDPLYQRARRLVEVVVNGRRRSPAAKCRRMGANTRSSSLCPIERSSWIALRQFPQLHTNPVTVIVGGKPSGLTPERPVGARLRWISSARPQPADLRRPSASDAERAYDQARAIYRQIAAESPADR